VRLAIPTGRLGIALGLTLALLSCGDDDAGPAGDGSVVRPDSGPLVCNCCGTEVMPRRGESCFAGVCDSHCVGIDAGPRPDGGPEPDAGAIVDAGATDAPVDAGDPDAAVDAGSPDAAVDGGPPDAAAADTGPDAPADAG
jgi:hypothetical protein